MRTHAVGTAIALYETGDITLEQAANYAGVTPGRMAESLRARGVEIRQYAERPAAAGAPLAVR
ncbi:UPF0175 family protein [Halomarina halobia]|uniref:UPF0175 family protein n=1 Tax=Halomarina halobia TaxID=3033386 RepID=A0ABD6A6X1_9EURY|nr:UPF0175 family protein [Halomarina sp. PSR21]